jgi:hypothetical protein
MILLKNQLQTFLLISTLALVSANAMAIDTLMLIPNIISGEKVFGQTKSAVYEINNGYMNLAGMILVALPLAILDENTDSITVDENELLDLNYSKEEINQYGVDVRNINNLLTVQEFSSKAEMQQALDSLNLGLTARELLRIK